MSDQNNFTFRLPKGYNVSATYGEYGVSDWDGVSIEDSIEGDKKTLCECGVDKAASREEDKTPQFHSNWCPMYKEQKSGR